MMAVGTYTIKSNVTHPYNLFLLRTLVSYNNIIIFI